MLQQAGGGVPRPQGLKLPPPQAVCRHCPSALAGEAQGEASKVCVSLFVMHDDDLYQVWGQNLSALITPHRKELWS